MITRRWLIAVLLVLGCGGSQKPGGPRVVIRHGKIETLVPVTFELDSDALKPESNGLLDEVADAIRTMPQVRRVRVDGHTDESGDSEYNLDLSRRRALSVKAYLVKKGVDPGRLDTLGHGRDQPVSDNATEEGRARNRRVEFILLE